MDFFQTIGEIILPYTEYLLMVAAIFVRLSVLAFLLPGLGETTVPVRVRLIVALVITWLVVPFLVPSLVPIQPNPAELAGIMLIEATYGFVLGFSFRVMIFVLQIAGTIIAQAMSLSQVFGNVLTEEPNPTVATLLITAGATLALTLDLHIEVIKVFIKSYEMFPMGSAVNTDDLAYWATQKAMGALDFSLSLALPFVILNFIYNVMLGVVNRAMPQLMVSFVGLPAITGAGLMLLAFSIATILTVWITGFNEVFTDYWDF